MSNKIECIKDYHGEEAGVKVCKFEFSDSDLHLVSICSDPNEMTYTDMSMMYTPDQVRQLAACLMEAVNLAYKGAV